MTALDPFQMAADLLDPPPYHDPWHNQARPDQLAPTGPWLIWLILAGRGWGKTRTGAEWVKDRARTGDRHRVALVASTFADGRDTMVEGESGLLRILPPSLLKTGDVEGSWNRSMGELFLADGARAKVFSAEQPGRLRGPQHHTAWVDEAAQFPDAAAGTQDDTTWSNLMLGLRLGQDPRAVVTTTPKPLKLIRDLMAATNTVITRGSTYDNLDNLAPTFRAQVLDRYEGTRLGRQELMAEILDDVEGALWTHECIDLSRVQTLLATVDVPRCVVAVDPAITSTATSDETGIVVAARAVNGHGYVLADRTCRDTPAGWARRAVYAYHEFKASAIVAEGNQGGEMVTHTIHTVDPTVPVVRVHASRGKVARAEPVAALYEQGKVHHVGVFDELEDQLCTWVPESGESPDRLDALVWALTDLMLGQTLGATVGKAKDRRGRR
mgnify:CR=1 FL=1